MKIVLVVPALLLTAIALTPNNKPNEFPNSKTTK